MPVPPAVPKPHTTSFNPLSGLQGTPGLSFNVQVQAVQAALAGSAVQAAGHVPHRPTNDLRSGPENSMLALFHPPNFSSAAGRQAGSQAWQGRPGCVGRCNTQRRRLRRCCASGGGQRSVATVAAHPARRALLCRLPPLTVKLLHSFRLPRGGQLLLPAPLDGNQRSAQVPQPHRVPGICVRRCRRNWHPRSIV